MTTLTLEQVKSDLRELAVEHPDRVASDGIYGEMFGYEPVCIVGHVLRRRLSDTDWALVVDFSNSIKIDYLLTRHLDADYDPEVAHLLQAVQLLQDQGMPWGDAVGAVLR